MNGIEFLNYCNGYESLCAGILKCLNAATSRYHGDNQFIFDGTVRRDIEELISVATTVGVKICKDFVGG